MFDHETLEEIPFKRRCYFSYRVRRFGELTVIFLGCPFLQGPSRYAVCVKELLLLLREIPRG